MRILNSPSRTGSPGMLMALALSILLAGCDADAPAPAAPADTPAPEASATQALSDQPVQRSVGESAASAEQMHDRMLAEDMHDEMSGHEDAAMPATSGPARPDAMSSRRQGQAGAQSTGRGPRMGPNGAMPADASTANGMGAVPQPPDPPMPMQDDPPMGGMGHM